MDLQVQKRINLGRGVKALRDQGLVPAELYGRGVENLHLTVPAKDFKKLFKEAGENTIVNILVDGQKRPALVNEVSYNYLSGDVESVAFYQVRMDEKIKVKIPLQFSGIAPAVKEKSGILVKALQELEVESLPANLPHSFAVSLDKLSDIGSSIYVKDLTVPAGVKILVNPETVVATVTAQVSEEEELAMQQAAGAAVDTIKVETEEKKAERDAAKATTTESSAAGAKETPKK